MLVEVKITLAVGEGRVLIMTETPGMRADIIDVVARDAEELDIAIGMITRSLRRTLVERLAGEL